MSLFCVMADSSDSLPKKAAKYVIESISEKYHSTTDQLKEHKDDMVDSAYEDMGRGKVHVDRLETTYEGNEREEAEEARKAAEYVENPGELLQEDPEYGFTVERVTEEIKQMVGGEAALEKASGDQNPMEYMREQLMKEEDVISYRDRQAGNEKTTYFSFVGDDAGPDSDDGDDSEHWSDRHSDS